MLCLDAPRAVRGLDAMRQLSGPPFNFLFGVGKEEIRSSFLHQICKNAPTSQVTALAVVGNETIRECHEDVRWAGRVTQDPQVSDEDAWRTGSCRYRT